MSSSATGSSSSGEDPFCHLLSMSRPIPVQPSFAGMCESVVTGGSFGMAPTPPPIGEQIVRCPLCLEGFREPKVLACFHSFCKPCLQRHLDSPEKIVCPQCHSETQLCVELGIDSLFSDYGLEKALHRQSSDGLLMFGSPSSTTSSSPPLSDSPNCDQSSSSCTGCKSGERASAFCQDCAHFLCGNCTMAHQYMHCFDGHRVQELNHEGVVRSDAKCFQHGLAPLTLYCLTCNIAICRECRDIAHCPPAHHIEGIAEAAEKQLGIVEALMSQARSKQEQLLDLFKLVDAAQNRLSVSMNRAAATIDESFHMIVRAADEHRRALGKELENAFGAKQLQLTVIDKKVQQMTEKLSQTMEFSSRLFKYATPAEVMVFKQLLENRLHVILNYNPDMNNLLTSSCELEFSALNAPQVRKSVASLMGSVRGGSVGVDWTPLGGSNGSGMPPTPIGRPPSRANRSPSGAPIAFSDSNLLRPRQDLIGSSQSLGPFSSDGFHYEKWSSGIEPNALNELVTPGETVADGGGELGVAHRAGNCNYQPRSQIKRQKMIYHCKFGEFGVMEGQFTEPSGVAVTAANDIVVADTNNHRIQVFDRDGRFKFQFGECGKRDGQLLYPNRVAVNRITGDFIVTERSPTHQIQVYNQYGHFLRKFGANILQHPRGVCVDNKGQVIVVECKVMRVLVFDMFGNVMQKFGCSRYLEFPNGVCTNDKREILISDNRAHCIKVFNYEGQFLRQIGGEGITNYPIGVGINALGEVVVADNHNNFNLTIFAQDGTLLSALESKVKHAQCFDVSLIDEGSVVLASKDYRLYLYRYQQSNAV